MTLTALAPGKVNLCLYLGQTRADGLHELVSVIEPLSLADELTLEPLPGGAPVVAAVGAGDMGCAAGTDEIVCAGVEGPNLAGAALATFRAASGWDGPPLRLTIVKRVPVAAGMGGGSGDAAAALRLVAHAAGRPAGDPLLARLAPRLGADVPSQVAPGPVLIGGAGEDVRPLPPLPPYGVLVLPSPHALATPDVFHEADRLGLQRDAAGLAERRREVEAALARGELPDPVNDLEPAARALCPSIDDALTAARAAGADRALVSGSGPTVVGIFLGAEGPAAAEAAAAELRPRFPGATGAHPVDAAFAAVRGLWHDADRR
jgi:4-diphosphocytidyl-2-C-methyl-D-erythritol kinase